METNENIFNLGDYFLEKYNYKFTNIDDLLKQEFIEYEGTGANAVCWVNIDGEKYLYKSVQQDSYVWVGEMLSKEFADILGIPCAEYKMCKLGDSIGILSKKFTKDNETIIIGAQMVQEVLDEYPWLDKKDDEEKNVLDDETFIDIYNVPDAIVKMDEEYQNKYLHNNLNNIEELWALADIYLDKHNLDKKYLMVIVNFLIKTFLFDLLTIQGDRHIGNWGIVQNLDTKEIIDPQLFDNSDSFTLWQLFEKNKMKKFYDSLDNFQNNPNNPKSKDMFVNVLYSEKMLLTASEDAIKNPKQRKRVQNLEVLDYFLKTSGKGYIDLVGQYIDKIQSLSLDYLLDKIEMEQGILIPDLIRHYLNDVVKWNTYLLDEKVNEYKVRYGRGLND